METNINTTKEEHLMRAIRALCCAVAITACLAPGVRGDEYNKQTFLTFSAPVQLPGVELPAGTYMFKLADPSSGRRTLQVWDKEGTKLYTTLLTIPDQRMRPSGDPVVMFSERPTGEMHAIKAWFYPGETIGQEFVYPKDQAMKIARASNVPVLAFDQEPDNASALSGAQVSRIGADGQVADNSANSAAQAPASTTASTAGTTTASTSTTSDQRDGAVGTSGTTAAPGGSAISGTRDAEPVGTTGTTAGSSRESSRVAQSPAGAAAAPQLAAGGQSDRAQQSERRELPRTASSMALVQMLGALALIAAVGVRVVRTHFAPTR